MQQFINTWLQKRSIRITLISLHTLMLLIFTWYWLNRTGLTPDEKQLIKWSSATKNLILPFLGVNTHKPIDPNQYLFIDVADALALIDHPDKGFGAKQDITDRRLLLKLFQTLNQHQEAYKFALCNIRFENPYKDSLRTDSLLALSLQKAKKIIFPKHLNAEGKNFEKSLFPNLPFGLADYTSLSDEFYKWKLIVNDSIKTLPLLMYEQLHQKKMQRNAWGLYTMNGNLSFNAVIPDLRLKTLDKNMAVFALEEFVNDIVQNTPPAELKRDYLQNRIIVIGALTGSRDMHKTFLGEVAGSLIILNVYHSLIAQNNFVPTSWLFLLAIAYFIIFYIVFFPPQITKPAWLVTLRKNPTTQILDYFIVFVILSLLSFWVYGIFLNVLILTLYIKIIQFIRKITIVKKLEKALAQAYEELQKEHDKSEKLLLNILPKEVAQELKEKGVTEVRHFKNTSILFADVKGFSALASKVTPQELIKELDATFTKMDEISLKYGLERIKTIGDCYMAVAGIPHPNNTNAVDITLAALGIQKWMNDERQARNGDFWQVRLGTHTGELVAGVIGKTKFAYDVWGSAVNLASRMESGGEVGKVNTTEFTKNITQDFFEFTYRGELEAKNIGKVNAYFVDRIKPELSADAEGFVPNENFWALYKEQFKP